MIRDLIDLGSFELAEKFKYNYSYFNLKNVLQGCSEIMKFQGELKNIEISFQFDLGIEEFIISDENRVKQIIINFLTNSLKFTQKNGKILIRAQKSNDNVKISVEDNGK